MAAEAVIARFAGEPSVLAPSYRAAAARYAATADAVSPRCAHLLADDGGIVVVLVWSDPPGHEPFGEYMQSVIGEVGLPFPEVSHLGEVASDWATLSESGEPVPGSVQGL
jgi:hypothetical protein